MKKILLEDLLINASFVRWVRNEATYEEEKYWNAWLNEASEHESIVIEARAVLTAIRKKQPSMPDINIELQKLDHFLVQEEQQNKVLQLKNNRRQFIKRKRFIAAAILTVGICISALFVNQYQLSGEFDAASVTEVQHNQEYKTDFGEKATFRLSDNSRIILNANSHIKFSTDNDGSFNTKEVWLDGEAYFDITNSKDDRQRTFTVYTSDGSVQVLGTRFAVKTLDSGSRAVLEEGEILIGVSDEKSGSAGNKETSVILEPGDMAHFSTGSNKIAVSQVNPRVYTSWNEDIWFFDDTPVSEIASRIEDTFGLRVNVEKDLKERKLSGSIKSTNLDVLTKALSTILKAPVDLMGREIYIGHGDRTASRIPAG